MNICNPLALRALRQGENRRFYSAERRKKNLSHVSAIARASCLSKLAIRGLIVISVIFSYLFGDICMPRISRVQLLLEKKSFKDFKSLRYID